VPPGGGGATRRLPQIGQARSLWRGLELKLFYRFFHMDITTLNSVLGFVFSGLLFSQ
jgi:hypothetical protein